MALYRLEAKIFSREKRGRSVVAAAAYRSGGKIRDEKYDRVHDYSRRSKGVVESVILRPENSPEWTAKPDTLWNTVQLGGSAGTRRQRTIQFGGRLGAKRIGQPRHDCRGVAASYQDRE